MALRGSQKDTRDKENGHFMRISGSLPTKKLSLILYIRFACFSSAHLSFSQRRQSLKLITMPTLTSPKRLILFPRIFLTFTGQRLFRHKAQWKSIVGLVCLCVPLGNYWHALLVWVRCIHKRVKPKYRGQTINASSLSVKIDFFFPDGVSSIRCSILTLTSFFPNGIVFYC